MIRRTKRIRKALAYIAANCYDSYILHWPIESDSPTERDVVDAITWIEQMSHSDLEQYAIRTDFAGRLRRMGYPELPGLDTGIKP